MTTISSGISSSGMGNWGGGMPRVERRSGEGGKPSFASIDTDGSGGLNQAELQSMIEKGPQGAHGNQGTQGTQGSNAVSGTASVDDLFSKLDSDGDGSVSESELDSGMKPPGRDGGQSGQNAFGGMGMDTQSFASMMGAGGMGGGMGGMGGMPPPPPPGDGGGFSLSSLDSDEDGSITQAEFGIGGATSSDESSASGTSAASTSSADEAQQALFDAIDSDKSGELSTTEVNAFQEQMKALLEKTQQMGMPHQQSGSDAGSRVSLTA